LSSVSLLLSLSVMYERTGTGISRLENMWRTVRSKCSWSKRDVRKLGISRNADAVIRRGLDAPTLLRKYGVQPKRKNCIGSAAKMVHAGSHIAGVLVICSHNRGVISHPTSKFLTIAVPVGCQNRRPDGLATKQSGLGRGVLHIKRIHP